METATTTTNHQPTTYVARAILLTFASSTTVAMDVFMALHAADMFAPVDITSGFDNGVHAWAIVRTYGAADIVANYDVDNVTCKRFKGMNPDTWLPIGMA